MLNVLVLIHCASWTGFAFKMLKKHLNLMYTIDSILNWDYQQSLNHYTPSRSLPSLNYKWFAASRAELFFMLTGWGTVALWVLQWSVESRGLKKLGTLNWLQFQTVGIGYFWIVHFRQNTILSLDPALFLLLPIACFSSLCSSFLHSLHFSLYLSNSNCSSFSWLLESRWRSSVFSVIRHQNGDNPFAPPKAFCHSWRKALLCSCSSGLEHMYLEGWSMGRLIDIQDLKHAFCLPVSQKIMVAAFICLSLHKWKFPQSLKFCQIGACSLPS